MPQRTNALALGCENIPCGGHRPTTSSPIRWRARDAGVLLWPRVGAGLHTLPFSTSLSPRSPWARFGAEVKGGRGWGLHPKAREVVPLRTPEEAEGHWGPSQVPCRHGRGREEGRCGTSILASPPGPPGGPSAATWPAGCRPLLSSLRRASESGVTLGGRDREGQLSQHPADQPESRPLQPEAEKHLSPTQGPP